MLARRLKEPEQVGLVRRRVCAEVPPHVEYSHSEYGRTWQPVLDVLYTWGRAHHLRDHPAATAFAEAEAAAAGPAAG